MPTRREFLERSLQLGATLAMWPISPGRPLVPPRASATSSRAPGAAPRETRPSLVASEESVNDVHSRLNRTRVHRIERPTTVEAVQAAVRRAAGEGRAISVAGGRHAMGGQQFGRDTVLLDTRGLRTVGDLDTEAGIVEVGAGIQWPELIDDLHLRQRGRSRTWSIVQKQTGADDLCLGGALAANVHGRGLTYRPIVQDVEAFTLVDAEGEIRRCSRSENVELFRLVIGGYGLFGVITSVQLRLAPRRKVRRVVEVADMAGLVERFRERIADGYLFGDFQYATDLTSSEGLRRGVFSCYRPVDPETPIPESRRSLSPEDWLALIALGHLDREEAFRRYAEYYRSTSGQVYWSDTQQLSTYLPDYHRAIGERIGPMAGGTEMITEIYVPRSRLESFLDEVRSDFLERDVTLIYGTIRLIERDEETFLAWARQSWACVIFNLHTAHDPASLEETAGHFRWLIDRGLDHGGSYFLTYHRWARREQVLAAYPRFPEFLALKRRYDPEERFQSDWYRHYREMFAW